MMEKNGNIGKPAKDRVKKNKEAAEGTKQEKVPDYLEDFSDKVPPKRSPAVTA